MKRVVVDRYGGPEVLRVVEDDLPRPDPGEVRVRVLAAGVSLTDAQLRAGTYLGVPRPPFTPGYEMVGVVDELGPCSARLHVGDRVAALTVYGGYAEYVCVPEAEAVEVPEGLDPAEAVGLVLTYTTAYQMLHRSAHVQPGESVLVHGAAGRVGVAVLELGALDGLRLFGTAAARDRVAVERLGAVAIDYRTQDFLARIRQLTQDGVDVVLDGIGGATSIRSFRALRPGGRLIVYGHYAMLARGRTSARRWATGWAEWYGTTATVALEGLLDPRRKVMAYRIQRLRDSRQWLPVSGRRPARLVGGGPRNPQCFREDLGALLELLTADKIHPVVTERLPLSEARRAHELLESSAAKGKLVLMP
jgi:NADPH2:quinone reductase